MTQAQPHLAMPRSDHQIIRIGECEVDLGIRALRRHGKVQDIGARAFDILAVLALAAGRIVTKTELMDEVWPDTIVEENNIHVHLSSIRKALGPDGKLILTVPRRGYQLITPRTEARRLDHTALVRLVEGTSDVMLGRETLLGREPIIAEIRSMLSSARVLTLVGTGGIGKTSIAREIEHRLTEEGVQDVHFVELAAHTTCQDVMRALVAGCGICFEGRELDLQLTAQILAKAKGLLIIDNAEHVVEHVAQLIESACRRSSELRVLITSRLPLRVPSEVVYRVGPLALPAPGDGVQATLNSPSIRLFLRRMLSNGQSIDMDEDRLHLVEEICRRLDGVPLAIELAAGRASVLGLERIRHGLEDPLLYLGGGYRTAEVRQRSLRASLDSSFEMLSDNEQAVFRRLCVFGCPFNSDAACLIAHDDKLSPPAVMDSVCELVDNSLLELHIEAGEATYQVLAAARSYGREKLAEAGELSAIVERHARYASGKSTDVPLGHVAFENPGLTKQA